MTTTSAISTILSNIAGLAVKFNGVAAPCWQPSQISDRSITMSVPRRVLSVIDPGIEAAEIAFIDLGKSQSITWRVLDTLYAIPVGEMAGFRRASDVLLSYVVNYVGKIHGSRGITSQAEILTASSRQGEFDWGSESFFGVEMELEVKEYISGG